MQSVYQLDPICCVSSVVLLYQVLCYMLSYSAPLGTSQFSIWKQGFLDQKATKDQPATFSSTNDLV